MKFHVAIIAALLLPLTASPGFAATETLYDLKIKKECIEGRFGCSNAPTFDFEYQASQVIDPVIPFQLAPDASMTFDDVVDGEYALALEYVPSGWTLVEIEIIIGGTSFQTLPLNFVGGEGLAQGIRYSGSGTGNLTEIVFRNTRNVSAVPIPAAAWLFISALGGLGIIKRKRS